MSPLRLLEAVRDDVRFGLRFLRRSPAFTVVALTSLALGLGANTAIFSLIDAVMLRPLPVRAPHQLAEIVSRYPGEPPSNGFSWTYFERYRAGNRVFSELIGMSRARLAVQPDGGEAVTEEAAYVVGAFFPALGVEPSLGRLVSPADDIIGSASAAVVTVSWAYWQARLGGNPGAVGRQLIVGGVPATVIGVLPRAFTGLQTGLRTDVWMPVAMEPLVQRPSARLSGELGMAVIGRLKPGVSLEQARADVLPLHRERIEEIATRSGDAIWRQAGVEVASAASGFSMLRYRFGRPLVALMAIVGLLLLVACTNVAGLLLARGVARQPEMAVRVSLGASRIRVVRQLLTESLLLSSGGCLLGLAVAHVSVKALLALIATTRMVGFAQIDIATGPDLRMLSFAAAAALSTGCAAGILPAWHASAAAPAAALRGPAGGADVRSRQLFGRGLVIANVALAVVMLSAAAIFMGHLAQLRGPGSGFARDSVLLVTLDPRGSGYDRGRLTQLYRELLGRLQAIPGVRSATLSAVTPVEGPGASLFLEAEGGVQPRPGERRRVMVNFIGPAYFATFGTPWIAGRDFTFDDTGRPRVAIVNQALAARYFPAGNAIGRHVRLERDEQPYEIVGIAGDAKYLDLYEPAPATFYVNAFQGAIASQFSLRTDGNPHRVSGAVRAAVADVLQTVRVARITTLVDQVDASIVPERLIGMLSNLFGAVGAVLAAVGLYGLLSYSVARRRPEIGTRMALGASRGSVRRLVLREALLLTTAGILVGIPLAAWGRPLATRLIDSLPAATAWPIGEAVLLMLAVALLAAWLPARRASRVPPLEAMRQL